jgi:hypothetical protein
LNCHKAVQGNFFWLLSKNGLVYPIIRTIIDLCWSICKFIFKHYIFFEYFRYISHEFIPWATEAWHLWAFGIALVRISTQVSECEILDI